MEPLRVYLFPQQTTHSALIRDSSRINQFLHNHIGPNYTVTPEEKNAYVEAVWISITDGAGHQIGCTACKHRRSLMPVICRLLKPRLWSVWREQSSQPQLRVMNHNAFMAHFNVAYPEKEKEPDRSDRKQFAIFGHVIFPLLETDYLVRTSLDNFCVKSGVLCSKCEEKLKKGQITHLDLQVVRILSELEKEFPILEEVSFERAVDAGDVLAILVNKQDVGKVLSSGGKIVRAIGEKTGRRIKILGYGGDSRQLIEDLFSPISILTINTVWLPDETTETKVILHGRRPRHMPVDFELARRLAKEIGGMTLRIEFEVS